MPCLKIAMPHNNVNNRFLIWLISTCCNHMSKQATRCLYIIGHWENISKNLHRWNLIIIMRNYWIWQHLSAHCRPTPSPSHSGWQLLLRLALELDVKLQSSKFGTSKFEVARIYHIIRYMALILLSFMLHSMMTDYWLLHRWPLLLAQARIASNYQTYHRFVRA